MRSDKHEEAIRILAQEYYDTVREIAEDFKKELESGEIKNREDLLDQVHERVDGNYWVIYTAANKQVLLVSNNSDAFTEEFGTEGLVKDGGVNWAAMAFMAMERDVYDQLEAIGVDINDPIPHEEDSEEED